jgi:hypothetical protein
LAGTLTNNWQTNCRASRRSRGDRQPRVFRANGAVERLTVRVRHHFERPGDRATHRRRYIGRLRVDLNRHRPAPRACQKRLLRRRTRCRSRPQATDRASSQVLSKAFTMVLFAAVLMDFFFRNDEIMTIGQVRNGLRRRRTLAPRSCQSPSEAHPHGRCAQPAAAAASTQRSACHYSAPSRLSAGLVRGPAA